MGNAPNVITSPLMIGGHRIAEPADRPSHHAPSTVLSLDEHRRLRQETAAENLRIGCGSATSPENPRYNLSMRKRTPYQDALRDPRWQRRRLEIMQRDGFTCQFCASTTTTLNVHHRWYSDGAAPWEYPDIALVTLCETCHGYETFLWPVLAKRLVDALRSSGVAHGGLAVLIDALEGQRLSVVDARVVAHRAADAMRPRPVLLTSEAKEEARD